MEGTDGSGATSAAGAGGPGSGAPPAPADQPGGPQLTPGAPTAGGPEPGRRAPLVIRSFTPAPSRLPTENGVDPAGSDVTGPLPEGEPTKMVSIADFPGVGHRRTHRLRNAAVLVLAVAVLTGGVITAVTLVTGRSRPPSIGPGIAAADAYLAAWGRRDLPAMAALVVTPPPDFAAANSAPFTALRVTAATFTRTAAQPTPAGLSIGFQAHLALAGLGPFDYQGTIPLRRIAKHWRVEWSPAVIHPDLGPGLHLARSRSLPTRATVLAADGSPLAKVAGAGADLVGATVTATAAQAPQLPAPYLAGDVVGMGGLEEVLNSQLAGAPSGDVIVADAVGAPVRSLLHVAGAAGLPVRTTINPNIEALADRVMAPVAQPAALVALDTATGNVVAVVSHPDGGFPRALLGRYPPGSTFKVVTATAALTNGLTPASTVECPPQVTVDGRTFTNAEHEQLGAISLQDAFARSCNTAFINVAKGITDAQLRQAAATLGVGAPWPAFPLSHFAGQIPPAADAVEHVADAIGQGKVSVSPLVMASIAAAVANGAWQPPRLLADAAPSTPTPLAPSVAAALRGFMRSVVTSGTGTAANLPGDPVYAKTGTAEFGSGTPPRTHAWLIGFRGNIAFAVLVEGGGFGGEVAAPLAARFLSGL